MNIEDYEGQLDQYEQEVSALQATNQEQAKDLHTMIQTVNEMKDLHASSQGQLEERENEIERLKQVHDS